MSQYSLTQIFRKRVFSFQGHASYCLEKEFQREGPEHREYNLPEAIALFSWRTNTRSGWTASEVSSKYTSYGATKNSPLLNCCQEIFQTRPLSFGWVFGDLYFPMVTYTVLPSIISGQNSSGRELNTSIIVFGGYWIPCIMRILKAYFAIEKNRFQLTNWHRQRFELLVH